MEWSTGWFVLLLGLVILAFAGGFFLARYLIKRNLEKNPPISKEQIRAMYKAMGKNASEAQLNAVMNSMKRHK